LIFQRGKDYKPFIRADQDEKEPQDRHDVLGLLHMEWYPVTIWAYNLTTTRKPVIHQIGEMGIPQVPY
jgi:hypothetical protein